MKKLCLLTIVSALAASVWALPSYVQFSSTGPDRYADGTIVLDGEVYACVWVKAGASFAGFTAQGDLVDPVKNKIIGAASLAKDGHCPTVAFILNGENANLPNGSFSVYLLDTRVLKQDGSQELSKNSESIYPVLNTWTTAGNPSVKAGEKVFGGEVTGSGVASVVPADTPNPKVTAMKVENGKVIVTIGDTVPYLRYGISSGVSPLEMNKDPLVKGLNGTADGELILIVDDPQNNRFFKVVRD